VLLDSDKEGRKQHSRYSDMFGKLVEDRVFCLEDVDAAWADRGMEAMFEEADQMAIQAAAYPDESRFKKDLFNRAVQEALVTTRPVSVSEASLARFARLLTTLKERLRGPTPP
jgi:CO/xanthine dehydrogenase FAD-binding subunit